MPIGSLEDANAAMFVPTASDCSTVPASDCSTVQKEFLILVARVLVQYVLCLRIFQDYAKTMCHHIFLTSFQVKCQKPVRL